MRVLLVSILLVCCTPCVHSHLAYALDQRETIRLTRLYNYTAALYSKLVRVIYDLDEEQIKKDTAEEQVKEWSEDYEETAESFAYSDEARIMVKLMTELLAITEDVVDDYEPMNVRTKEALKKFDAKKKELKKEMDELRYTLQ